MEDSEEFVEDIGVLAKDEEVMNFKDKGDSRPTKEKVAAFKSRVYHLLFLFVEKAKSLAPILPLLTEEAFVKDPSRLRELIIKIVNRSPSGSEDILRFAHIYKQLLLFKNKKESPKFGEDFIHILKKIKQDN